jgi:ATP-dependent protease ClpP protease subunit
MTRRLASSYQLPAAAATRPEDVAGVMLAIPTYRFWGTAKPPKRSVFQMLATPRTSGAGSSATIRVYGPIDSWGGIWGVSSQEVSAALDALPAGIDSIQLRINSPGGEVFEAMAILNMLRAHPARTVAVVDGIAASASSFLAAGCDETVMSPGTQMMIHDARTFAYGPPKVMRKVAEVLDSLSDSAADLYAEAAGGDAAAWRALMGDETWYTAKEAVAAGLADSVAVVPDEAFTETAGADPDEPDEDDAGDTPDDAPLEDRFDLTIFTYAGRRAAPAPVSIADTDRGPEPEGAPVEFTDEQAATLRQQLGLPDDADAATIVAASAEALEERAADPAPPTPPAGVPAALPDGVVAIDSGALSQMRTDAQLGRAAHDRQALEDRDRALTTAVSSGRIPPARRAHWQALWDADPEGTAATLTALEPGVVPVSEIGIGTDADPEAGADSPAEAAMVDATADLFNIPKEAIRA